MLKELKRQRLQTLARDIGKSDTAVLILSKENCCTDRKRIYVKDFEELGIVSGVPCTEAEKWVALKAVTAHEAAHVRFTDISAVEGLTPLEMNITNALEDGRIERALEERFPGAKKWLDFTNHYVIKHRKIPESPFSFIWALAVAATTGIVPDVPEKDLVLKCVDLVEAAVTASNTKEVVNIAKQIAAVPEVKDLFAANEVPPVAIPGTRNAEEAPAIAATKAVRRLRTLKRTASAPNSQEISQGTNGALSGADESKEQTPNKLSETKSTENAAELEDKKPDCFDEESSAEDAAETENSIKGTPELNSPENPESFSKSEAFTSRNETNSVDSKEPEAASQDVEQEENLEASAEEPENSSADGESEEFFDGEENAELEGFNDEENLFDPEENFDDEESFLSPEEDFDCFEPEEVDIEKENASELENSNNEEHSSEEDLEHEDLDFESAEEPVNIEDFSQELEKVLEENRQILAEAEEELKAFIRPKKLPVKPTLKETAKELAKRPEHENVGFIETDLSIGNLPDFIQPFKGRINNLVRELTNIIQTKKTRYFPAKKGSLNPTHLYKIKTADPTVFRRKEIPDALDMAAYILVDCSGSMYGIKTRHASQAAAVITNALIQVGIPAACAGFNTKDAEVVHIHAKRFEKPQTYCLSLKASGENRDGFSVRLAASELLKRPEAKKILFVLSDGLPSHCDYSFPVNLWYEGSLGIKDTAEAVREAEREGIIVIGLFFGYESDLKNYQFMYPNSVFAIRSENLEAILARKIKILLEE